MRIATWNIYWLGERSGDKIRRGAEDLELIAEVLKNVSADVLAFQEVVDPAVLEAILKKAGGSQRDYSIRAEDGPWFSSTSNPDSASNNYQKIFLAMDRERVEFLGGVSIPDGPAGRKPYAARLRDRSSETEFVVVAVHLRSGYPIFLDVEDAAKRRQEASALARWLHGEAAADNPSFPIPTVDRVIVLGDFNAQLNDPNGSLDPLREGSLSDWTWDNPMADGSHFTTAVDDGYVIDFIMLSPVASEGITQAPTVYAFDHDPRLGGSMRFHTGTGSADRLKNYRVSDHRPVVATLDLR
jgi:endonuclease/exonuclease/phosphatase family metal-dependent hydrolase